jgi:hypothetical protein
MPYITKGQRALILSGSTPTKPGELNFLLTTNCLEYIKNNFPGGASYTAVNDVVGALECCKLEFYRRLAVPYEDTKIRVNSDVYP